MNSRDIRNYSQESKISKCDGRISACKQCSGVHCCGVLVEGGTLEPPYLTKQDIENIQYFTGLKIDQFAIRRTNPVTGNTFHKIKVKPNQGCVFFDQNEGKCEIHAYRPMDCRLFPLDIEFRDGKYYWSLFRYVYCNLSKDDWNHLMEYKDIALQILGSELHDYATNPVPGMVKVGYQILTEVRFKCNYNDQSSH